MAATNPRIFTSLTISNAGGTTSSVTYDLSRVEGLSVNQNPIEDKVDDGQTIQHGYDTEVTFETYDIAILSDARVQNGATIPANKARLVFTAVAGGVTETHDGVRLSATTVRDDQQRPFYRVKYTRMTAGQPITNS